MKNPSKGMNGSALEGLRFGVSGDPLPGCEEVLTVGSCPKTNDLHLDYPHLAKVHAKFKVVFVDDANLGKKKKLSVLDVSESRNCIMVNGI